MSRRAIRNGDATTTGGIVIAGTASIFVDDKHIALDGDKATCGNCEGRFPIAGSAVSVVGDGRAVAVEGDAVLCPCGQNFLVASNDCMPWTANADSHVSTIIHEATHFQDTMSSTDDQYTITPLLPGWGRSNPDLAINNADSIAGYVVDIE
ncbi:PAAR domain-containing protein [Burkholderia cepacia]|uniref:PAAR domain-containing protein n=1 Tax=Burkholderia cepacia TaxID=292 RepID=UPI0009BF60E3|nr:PAAR domain-containing protein [Burkholderia cepacia]